MKINSITPLSSYPKAGGLASKSVKGRESAFERDNLKQVNNDQINTTIKKNSDGRVSFKGGAPFIHKVANFAYDNPLVAEAIFAIFITCGLRPLTIMATAKNEEEKEKCSYQAAKSISSGLVGLATTALVGTPIAAAAKRADKKGAFKMPEAMKEKSKEIVKEGVTLLDDLSKKLLSESADDVLGNQIKSLIDGGSINLSMFEKAGKGAQEKFISQVSKQEPSIIDTVKKAMKEQKILNNYQKTTKNIIDKFFQPVFMPLRATITIALVPVLLGLIGKKKPEKKQQQPQQSPQAMLNYEVFQNSKEKALFEAFSGVATYASK